MSPALFVVVGLVAGCGGSTPAATQASTTASSASPAAATASTAPAATTTPAPAPSFASTQNCQQLVDLGAKYLREVSAASGGGPVDLSAAVRADQALADASPSGIHSDAEFVVHAFSGYVGTLANVGYTPGTTPTPAQIAGITTAAQQFTQPQFQAAMQRVSAWVRQNCHGVTP